MEPARMAHRQRLLESLRALERRIRAIATTTETKLTARLLDIAEDLQADARKLESELLEEAPTERPG